MSSNKMECNTVGEWKAGGMPHYVQARTWQSGGVLISMVNKYDGELEVVTIALTFAELEKVCELAKAMQGEAV